MTETTDGIDDCRLLQTEEYEVLESIYPDYIPNAVSFTTDGSLRFEVPIELGEPCFVLINDEPFPSGNEHESETLSLSLLPPLLLHIILPANYPISQPPVIESIRATHLWFPNIAKLRSLLIDKWQEGEGVLYDWITYIHDGQFLNDMGLRKGLVLRLHHVAPQLLAPLLASYEASAKNTEFNQNSYPCAICLSHFKGSKCLRLSCQHIFCRSCLEDFWGLCIKEGDVERVGCPDPDCVKRNKQASEEEVARAVTSDQVARWRWLKEKALAEKDPTIIHCPMSFCQNPVPKPPVIDGKESGWDRLRTCSKCSYSFCEFCKRTWHGPLSACPISVSETIVLEYLGHPQDSSGRSLIERRFGRNNILRLVAAYEEEQLNRKWLEASTTACPGCGTHVEKSLGCAHMACKCGIHFCYRCGQRLQAANPYKHFSTEGLPCYGKLFDSESVRDGEDWEAIFMEEL
ncbi:hypothetical protein K435DRAFT_744156 [Dendrothele bispora CBS 962.96]|uniref:RBR-type E3 ubiquitin transferase n=1 Tax=Dendrothele bispora (strain CBS 962.96) TaxID=1314807 RepID=A0A4S8MSW9_DENBC|nr:hypothetical protein K435DRAFT_744156 [Dendrothele bispora CBS 962.96]